MTAFYLPGFVAQRLPPEIEKRREKQEKQRIQVLTSTRKFGMICVGINNSASPGKLLNAERHVTIMRLIPGETKD